MEEDVREVEIESEEATEEEPLPTTVTCTEHTQENLRNYGILLAFGLVMVVSCVFSTATTEPGQTRMMLALGVIVGGVMALLAGYMLVVWKNRQIVVGEQGVEITDFMGKVRSYGWDDVRIVDGRTTSTGGISFKTRDKREEPFAPSCGGFHSMCELLIRMGKLRRIDEAALARKRRMKSLFDVVQGGTREKADESLYLPEKTTAPIELAVAAEPAPAEEPAASEETPSE